MVKNGALLATPFATVAVDSAGRARPDRRRAATRTSRRTATSTSTRRARRAASRTTGSAASPLPATSPPPASEVDAARLAEPLDATNHNGGGMHFGSDGKLYVGVGDNANGAQAQDLALPFGKLLRLNDDGTHPERQPVLRDRRRGLGRAVWAYGLRNPVHVRRPARHRPDPHQRRRREHVGGDRRRQRRRELRLARIGGPGQRRRRNRRAALHLQAQRRDAARLGPGRLLQGFRDLRRRVLSGERLRFPTATATSTTSPTT